MSVWQIKAESREGGGGGRSIVDLANREKGSL